MKTSDPRFELIRRCHDGVATAEELSQLENALRQDAVFRVGYLRYMNLDVALSAAVEVPECMVPSESRWITWRPLMAAAAAIALLGVVLWPVREQVRTNPVATLLFSEGCEWQDGVTRMDGLPLEAGELQLKRGMAVVRFVGGAEMVLSGDTSVDLDSRGSVRVRRGHITVRVNEEGVGFKVYTPSRELTDLGTEFEVKVSPDGQTELQVLDGAVSYANPGASTPDAPQVTAGKAVRFAAASHAPPSEIKFDARPFADILERAEFSPRDDMLLVYEPFDYADSPLPLNRADHGMGWAGTWRVGPLANLLPSDPGDLHIATDRLHGPWGVKGGRRGMLEVDGRFGSRMRALAQPVRLDRDGIYYLSMMVRWEVPANQLKSKAWRFLRLALRSSTDYEGDRVSLTLPGFLRPQVQTSDGYRFMSPAHVNANEAQLWCAKIIARAHGEDEVSFRIYGESDTLDFAEPAYWHVASQGEHSDAVLDQLILAAGGVGKAWFDELRIAKSWREVMPPKLPTH
ncbi:MAG: FecR domain-containing protein [Verrucomicrobiaceae bacterium]|nr:FecR domain-containing protein [Verrucomicrobiaceae bacterium]